MRSLSELTSKIRQWNLMGFSLLPSLEIGIIHNQALNEQIIDFLRILDCKQLLYHEISQTNDITKEQIAKLKIQNEQTISLDQNKNQGQGQSKEASNEQNKKQKSNQIIKEQNIDQNKIKQHQECQLLINDQIIKQTLKSQRQVQIQKLQQQSTKHKSTQQLKNSKRSSLIQKWDQRISNSIYAIYLINTSIEARVHLILDEEYQGQINDQNFKKIKKIIQRLKRNKNMIFLNFHSNVHKLDAMSEHIQKFGLSYKSKQRQIKADLLLQKRFYDNQKITRKPKINNVIQSNSVKKIQKQTFSLDRQKEKDKTQIVKNQTISSNNNNIIQLVQFKSIVRSKLNEMFTIKQHNFNEIILSEIEKKYVNLFGVDINRNYNQMKKIHKQISSELKRYEELMKFVNNQKKYQAQLTQYELKKQEETAQGNLKCLDINSKQRIQFSKQKDLTSYVLHCLYQTSEYLTSSLMGTYSSVKMQNYFFGYKNKGNKNKLSSSNTKRSIHWQTMQIMNQIWDIEGDALMKQIDKMPISYIKQRYKMLDYQTIGGFMPSSCFQAIFSNPLRQTLSQIMETLQIIQLKIVTNVKNVVQYFFDKTNICYDFSDILSSQICEICRKFRKQTQKMLKSQIQYISTSSDDFWAFKQVKSSLYGPEQQIYIQIKYIGKNYIKKVFDNIKETVPRLIGQNLLKQIVLHLETKSLNILTKILNEIPIQIQIKQDQLKYLKHRKKKQKQIDQLIYFFSLRTNSITNIKNLHERLQKNWRRQFKNSSKQVQKIQETPSTETQKKGFIAWALNLIKRNKKRQQKRSSSQQKNLFKQQSNAIDNPQFIDMKKQKSLSQKNWLLIINIDKQVQRQKIQKSSQQGFPEKLRPSIWLYLAKQQYNSKVIKIQSILDSAEHVSSEQKKQLDAIFNQIEKDVLRTPPKQLFKQGYLKQSITRVLRAYAITDKDLRYTQGMNFIVAIILCVLTHFSQKSQYSQDTIKSKTYFQSLEEKCLLIFNFMMQKKGLRKIMFIQRATITDLCVRLEQYIAKKSPLMNQKIERSGFTVEMIFSAALISGLTTSQIKFNLQKRVIDMLITQDFNILYKIIGQFVASSQNICQKMQNENLYYFLKGKFYNEVFDKIGEQGLGQMFGSL